MDDQDRPTINNLIVKRKGFLPPEEGLIHTTLGQMGAVCEACKPDYIQRTT